MNTILLGIYIVGAIIAFVMGILLASYYEMKRKEDDDELQYGMIAAIAIMSWISVVMLIWNYNDQYEELFQMLKQKLKK